MGKLYMKEEKLKYVITRLNLSNKDISEKLELGKTTVSNLQNYRQNTLKKHHLYAICSAFNIPMEIFEDESISTKEKIDKILKNRINIFHKNYELLNKLKGDWYLYSYPSNSSTTETLETKTTIYEDFSVKDIEKNKGELFIGKNQSIILKEHPNNKNITSITFDNNRVTYGNFPFSRVSKSNVINEELFDFGFFSKEKIALDEATKILGELKDVQLKIDHTLLERINDYAEER